MKYKNLKITVNVCAFLAGMVLIVLLFGCSYTPRKWSSTEKAFLITSFLATGADYYTTSRALDNGARELNPIYGSHPSDSQLIATMALSQLVVIGIAHYHPDLRKWLLGGKTILNTGCAIYNSRLE